MSIISKIPDNSRVRYPVVRFESAVLNGLGQYDFSIAGNQNIALMLDLVPQNVYLIERANFYADVPQGDWLEGISIITDFPRVNLSFQGATGVLVGGASIYGEPFRCVNYVDNNEQLIYFRPLQKGDILVASMNGRVVQSAGMVGSPTLVAQMNYTVYEITDKNWIREFEVNPSHSGAALRL